MAKIKSRRSAVNNNRIAYFAMYFKILWADDLPSSVLRQPDAV